MTLLTYFKDKVFSFAPLMTCGVLSLLMQASKLLGCLEDMLALQTMIASPIQPTFAAIMARKLLAVAPARQPAFSAQMTPVPLQIVIEVKV
jgi:hypothetical protein